MTGWLTLLERNRIQVTPGNELLIGKIQTLDQADQQSLMVALEPVRHTDDRPSIAQRPV